MSQETIPFVDTHVHFWDFRHPLLRWDWLRREAEDAKLGDYGAIKSLRYLPQDLLAEARFSGVEQVVHVQAAIGSHDPVDETRWLQDLAAQSGVPQGIIGYADLASGQVEEVLRSHSKYRNLCGIRDLRWDEYFDNENWRRGYALLERYNLVCCDAPSVERMPKAADLAAAYPGVVYCVDHLGYPSRRDRDYFNEWATALRRLGRVENTIIKVSALGTFDREWTVASLRPWILECIDVWGPQRVVFGSNWPVDRLYSSYGELIAAYRDIVSTFSVDEQNALLSGNARRVFRLT